MNRESVTWFQAGSTLSGGSSDDRRPSLKKCCAVLCLLAVGSIGFPSLASSCACCGIDNHWSQKQEALSSYTGSILLALEFDGGEFNDAPAYKAFAEILSVQRTETGYIFKTTEGDFKLILEGPIEHRMSDLTFALVPDYKLTDVASIYHELVVPGTLTIPERYRAQYRSGSIPLQVEVEFVAQGVGSMCTGEDTFQRWLVKPTDLKHRLTGAGSFEKR